MNKAGWMLATVICVVAHLLFYGAIFGGILYVMYLLIGL